MAVMTCRLVRNDVALDERGADRAVELRRQVSSASVVDATLIVAAEYLSGPGDIVEVLTSDPGDLSALASNTYVIVDVQQL